MMFNMLCGQTIKQVAGGFDHSFWSVDVLLATQVYPAIWHASLALAATHTRMKVASLPDSEATRVSKRKFHAFALREYNLAIQHLLAIAHKSNPLPEDQETLLLSSLLFTGLSSLLGNMNEAIDHASNGLRVFYQWRYWERQPVSLPRQNCLIKPKSLISAYTDLEIQFANRLDYVKRPPWRGEGILPKPSEVPFASFTDAFFEFQPMLAGYVSELKTNLILGRYEQAMAAALAYRRAFAVWRAKFRQFKEVSKPQAAADKRAELFLTMFSTAFSIAHHLDPGRSVADSAENRAAYYHVVEIAEKLFKMKKETSDPQEFILPQFSFTTTFCEVLGCVGVVCKDRPLRRRVISLLKKWPQRDGMWDSRMIAGTIEAIMTLEESMAEEMADDGSPTGCGCVAGTHICGEHRVCWHQVEFKASGKAKILMMTNEDVKYGRYGTEAILAC